MTSAWEIAFDNFRYDDGSLPSIEFTGLRPDGASAIYQFIAARGRCVAESPTVWDNAAQADVPLFSLADPARLVQEGRIACFHCCYAGVSIDGATVPPLGMFVFRGCVELDFRMGDDWNEKDVDAFFRLIARLKSLAPEAKIRSAEVEGLVNEDSFLAALSLYVPQAGRTNG